MMRLSVVVAPEDAPQSAFVVWRGLAAALSKARDLGYDGLELALAGAEDVRRDELARALKRAHLSASCISTGLVCAQRGLTLTDPDRAVRAEAARALSGLVELAADLGGRVNLGRARGGVGVGQTRAQAEALFLEGMDLLLRRARPLGVELLIEPVNRYESNFVNTLAEGARLARQLGPGVGVMADLFHMNIEESDIAQALWAQRALVRYVHAADSNRLAPGLGHTDFPAIFNALNRAGFDGWVGVEVLPGDYPDAMAARAARSLRPLMVGAARGGGDYGRAEPGRA